MKTLRSITFAISILPPFLMGEETKQMDFTLPLPGDFIRYADKHRADTGQDLESYFINAGISIPKGGRISINRPDETLDLTLPQEEALKVIRIVSWCVENSSARAFRGIIREGTPEAIEFDTRVEFPIPEAYANKRGISIHLVKQDGRRATCMIVNNSDRPTWFEGQSLRVPFCWIQVLSDTGGTKHQVFAECDPEIRTPKLSPRRACAFQVTMPETSKPVRIGIALLDDISIQQDENTIWTDPIKMPGTEGD